MTAFAAAIDTLFSDPNLGADATYTPVGGSALSVRAVTETRRLDQQFEPFRTGAIVTAYSAEVRASEVAQPQKGDTLQVNSRTFKVMSFEPDADKLSWRLDLDLVS